MSSKMLNRRQAFWSQTLGQCKFMIAYQPGPRNGNPDALTTQSGNRHMKGDERLMQQQQQLVKQKNLRPLHFTLTGTKMTENSALFPSIKLPCPYTPSPALQSRRSPSRNPAPGSSLSTNVR